MRLLVKSWKWWLVSFPCWRPVAAAIRRARRPITRRRTLSPKPPSRSRVVPGEVRSVWELVEGLGPMRGPARPHRHPDARGRGARPRAAGRSRGDRQKGQPIVELDTAVAQADLAEKTATRDGLKASLALLKSLPRPEERRANELAIEQAKVAVEPGQGGRRSAPSAARDGSEVSEQQIFDAGEGARAGPDPAADGRGPAQGDDDRPAARGGRRGRGQDQDGRRAGRLLPGPPRLPHHPRTDRRRARQPDTATPARRSPSAPRSARWSIPGRSSRRSGCRPGRLRPVRIGQAARVRPGDARDPSPDASAEEEEEMAGKVAFVGRVADPQTGNLPIRVLVDNPQGRLTIGQSVRVSIIVDERKGVLQVPAAAILDLGEGPVLNVVRDGKTVVLHPEVGTPHGGWVGSRGHRPQGGRAGDRRGRIQPARRDPVKPVREAEAETSRAGRGDAAKAGEPAETEMSLTAGAGDRAPRGPPRGGINLVALARPYFGLIVLTTSLLTAFGVVVDAPHAQRHLSRGRLPADRGHRPDAGPGGQGRRGGRHPADRGGRRHRAGRGARPIEVGPRGRRAVDRLRPRHRHDPGAQRRPRPHGRGRRTAPARAPPRSPSGRLRRSSRSSRSSSPAAATRRRSTTTPTTTCGPGSAASRTSPTSPSRGATSARSSSRSTPRPSWRPTSRSPTWPTG